MKMNTVLVVAIVAIGGYFVWAQMSKPKGAKSEEKKK